MPLRRRAKSFESGRAGWRLARYEPDELSGCSTPRHRYYATCRSSAILARRAADLLHAAPQIKQTLRSLTSEPAGERLLQGRHQALEVKPKTERRGRKAVNRVAKEVMTGRQFKKGVVESDAFPGEKLPARQTKRHFVTSPATYGRLPFVPELKCADSLPANILTNDVSPFQAQGQDRGPQHRRTLGSPGLASEG